MKSKTRKIAGWSLSILIVAALSASATDKILGSQHALEMGSSFGLSAKTYAALGAIELVAALLFMIPRVGILGTLLLTAYFGGAIATHLQHQQDIIFPIVFEALIWLAATIRFPELTQRLFGEISPP